MDILGIFSFAVHTAFYYMLHHLIMVKLKPSHVPRDVQLKNRMLEVPMRTVGIIHAIVTTWVGYGYVIGMYDVSTLYETRAFSIAYLIFDFLEHLHNYDRNARLGKVGTANHPAAVAFHHVATGLVMFGYFFNGHIGLCLAYFLGELPVIFLNITWILMYRMDEDKKEVSVFYVLTVITYFFCRVIMFAAIFLFGSLPSFNWKNPLGIPFLGILVIVYLLNLFWFFKLIRKGDQFFTLPKFIGGIASITNYSLGIRCLPTGLFSPPKKTT